MAPDEEAKGTDYLARTVYETRKIGRIGFVHHEPKPRILKPVSRPTHFTDREIRKTVNMIKTKPMPKPSSPKKGGKGGKKC